MVRVFVRRIVMSVRLFVGASARKSESIFGRAHAKIQSSRASFIRPNGRRALQGGLLRHLAF
ncbi:hypothetical protein AGR1B_Cc10141 [Agrobacterium fabacearum S56]|nr:hypothetical protein AGR1B_Cc10141 [Agrobacterium fabacearum S56]